MKRENNDNTSRNTQIEEFLSARYEFRYNTVLNRAEYRPHQYPQKRIGQGNQCTDLARKSIQHHRKRFLPTHQPCAGLFPQLTDNGRSQEGSNYRPCRLQMIKQSWV